MQLETCARCHSRRHIVHANYRPGNRYADHYGLSLLQEGLYHADGQILDEVYVYGSFLQSRMFHEKVACTDCHDPHTAGRRISEKTGKPLVGNNLCTRCHTLAKYDGPAHHHHAEKEGLKRDGARCVDCHMPDKKYMLVDPRRDHSLRVPRPDLTVQLGTPNACNACHDKKEETPQWAAAKVAQWFGEKRAGNESFAQTLALGRAGKPEGEALLIELAKKPKAPAIARATAVSLLRNYPASLRSLSAAERALADKSELVRSAAVRTLGQLVENIPLPRPFEFLDERLSPLLNDPQREVRIEAARVLSAVPPSTFNAKETESLSRALQEYIDAQDAVAERYTAHMNRGTLYERLAQGRQADRDRAGAGEFLAKAVQAYETAIRVEPNRVGPRSNLAPQYDRLGRDADARKLRQQESQLLARNIGFLPKDAGLRYRYGMMQYTLGKMKEAELSLVKACELAPGSEHFLMSLALFFHKIERWDEALNRAERLLKMQPRNPTYRQIHDRIRRRLPSD
jgi:predicted CXXCH cytochrome family protein